MKTIFEKNIAKIVKKPIVWLITISMLLNMGVMNVFAEETVAAPQITIDLIPGGDTNASIVIKSEQGTYNRVVTATTSDIETIVNKTKSELKGPQPALKFDRNSSTDQTAQGKKRELYADNGHFTDSKTITVTGAPAGYPFRFVGYGDYSAHYVSKIRVIYERDEAGNAVKDSAGNYVIKELQHSNGTPLTINGEPTTSFDGPYDQTTGTRPQHFLLMDENGDTVYAYCIDLGTGAVSSEWYAVANLEDNNYYASQEAEDHVRGIVFNGYWGTADGETGSLSNLKAALKAALKEGIVESEHDVHFRNRVKNSGQEVGEDQYVYGDYVYTKLHQHVTLTDEIIDGLTEGEALDAMQCAIWSYANGSRANLDGTDRMIVGDLYYASSALGDSKHKLNDFEGAARTKALYEYLIQQTASASSIVINDKTFAEHMALTIGNPLGDDIYEASLKFSMAANPNQDKDKLNVALTYVDADGETQRIVAALTGENALTADEDGFYSIDGLKLKEGAKFSFTLNIVGEQYLEKNAYIYTAESGTNGSQTMVGMAEGIHTIDISMSADASFNVEDYDYVDRVINICKTSEKDQGTVPLEGIAFDMYYICSLDEFTKNYNNYVTIEDGKEVVKSSVISGLTNEDFIERLVTDSKGMACYNLTEHGNPDGIYLFVERKHPAIEEPIAPFYVTIPGTSKTGDTKEYTINLRPKNRVLSGPDIFKDVTNIDNNLDSFDVNEVHTWIIRSGIPVDMANGKLYKISDTLDYRLNYAGNLVVKVAAKDDEAKTETTDALVLGTPKTETEKESGDYLLTVTDNEDTIGTENVDSFVIKLTSEGMKKVADTVATLVADANADLPEDSKDKVTADDYELRVYFDAVIDEDASVGELIPNKAHLDYINSVGFDFHPDSDIPVVYTCGINLYKYDAKDAAKALEGAVFKLAKQVDQTTEGATPLVTKEKGTIYVVYEDFYTAIDAQTEKLTAKANTVTTTSDGDAMFYGLAEGTYYLVEIQAPSEYNLLSYPVAVTLNENSHLVDNTIEVANSNQFKLPETGGIGTTIFTVSGMMMLAAAVVVLVMKKKKED